MLKTLTIRLLLLVGLACGYLYATLPTPPGWTDGLAAPAASGSFGQQDRALRFDTYSEGRRDHVSSTSASVEPRLAHDVSDGSTTAAEPPSGVASAVDRRRHAAPDPAPPPLHLLHLALLL